MSEAPNLNAKAMDCLLAIEKMNALLKEHKITDYLGSTGFCDESDAIWNELYDQLGRFTSRASRLTRRIHRHQEEQKENAPSE